MPYGHGEINERSGFQMIMQAVKRYAKTNSRIHLEEVQWVVDKVGKSFVLCAKGLDGKPVQVKFVPRKPVLIGA